MNQEARALLERILSFAAKRAEVHFQFAKEKEDDGAMFFTEDYKAYVSILDDATTALDILKQPKDQPTSEFTERLRRFVKMYENEVPRRAEINLLEEAIKFVEQLQKAPEQPATGEYPNSEFTKVQRKAAQLAADAYEEDQEWCPTKTSRLLEACDRLDSAEASKVDLLTALESVQRYNKAAKEGRVNPEENGDYWEVVMDEVEAAIAKDKKGKRKMERLDFLNKARQLAFDQIVSSSALTDSEYADIQNEIQNEAMNEEEALYQKAKVILEDAAFDMDD